MTEKHYNPTDHDGLRKDGEPDKRVGTGQFAYDQVDPSKAGRKGGLAKGGSEGDSNDDGSTGGGGGEDDGKKQFAGGKVDPVEAGRQGGLSS